MSFTVLFMHCMNQREDWAQKGDSVDFFMFLQFTTDFPQTSQRPATEQFRRKCGVSFPVAKSSHIRPVKFYRENKILMNRAKGLKSREVEDYMKVMQWQYLDERLFEKLQPSNQLLWTVIPSLAQHEYCIHVFTYNVSRFKRHQFQFDIITCTPSDWRIDFLVLLRILLCWKWSYLWIMFSILQRCVQSIDRISVKVR